ncbi:piggyBac transposable element-derived protein 3-like [Palaemon carinicauda]|uniref:piggyBac transposable element-derived protein 3-like n=1 Tax=Palaemon carinicauda TaxID=392227 RepID=UPI0035B5C338
MPNNSYKKEDLVNWLRSRKIQHPAHATRPELLKICRGNRLNPVYIVDNIICEWGHEVVRLPPAHPELNAIEQVWDCMKRQVCYSLQRFTRADLFARLEEARLATPTNQFIRGKLIRWGYKAWAACTPLGYAFTLDLYQGKYEGNNPYVYASEYSLGGKVVLNILDTLQAEYPGIRVSLYFDKFFTSIKLLKEIKRRGHGATGTLRANRVDKCPLTINKTFKKLPRGSEEHFSDRDSQILVVRWNDNGVISIGSNEHGTFPMEKVERYLAREKKKVSMGCPRLINI